MERRGLGSSGISCGVIGMGTWQTFDVPLSDHVEMETRQDIVSTALESGVDLFDSSPMYGRAEAVLSRTLEGRRNRALVATKVWAPSVMQGKQQIERALQYYGGRVDVYQIHNLVSWQEYLPMLQGLKEIGEVGGIGITHYAHSAFAELIEVMESHEIDTVQIPYNVLDRSVEDHILPLAEERGIGVIVMKPLGAGRLTRAAPPLHELEPLGHFGVTTWAQALLKWVVSDPRISVAIPATSKVGRARENALAGNPPFFGPDERERVAWLAGQLEG